MKNNVCPNCGCEEYIVLSSETIIAYGNGSINLYACPCCCNVYVQRSVVQNYFDQKRAVPERLKTSKGRRL